MAKRPPFTTTGFPKRPDSRRLGWVASVGMHLVVLLLLLLPQWFTSAAATESSPGAGGPGPAGGGGGGTGGTGGAREAVPLEERLQYIRVAAQAPEPEVAEEKPVVPPPEPVPEPVPEPDIALPTITQVTNVRPTPAPAVITGVGVGGGTGNDGTSGTGPGSGGGVGSGIGTGRGTGVGPGTGGGDGEIYPPTPNHFFIPPLPAPDRVKGFELIARFEVDEKGKATLLGFNPTPDRDYNRKLREALERLRWRPAVRPDGTPVRHTAAIHYSF